MVAVQGFEPWTHKGTAPDVRRARRNYAAGAVRNRLRNRVSIQSEWDFRKAEGSLTKASRLIEMKRFTEFRKSLARSEPVSPGGIKWIASAASDMDQGQISCHSAK
jgi:hypothetical protein